jgi:hypothetical protein
MRLRGSTDARSAMAPTLFCNLNHPALFHEITTVILLYFYLTFIVGMRSDTFDCQYSGTAVVCNLS